MKVYSKFGSKTNILIAFYFIDNKVTIRIECLECFSFHKPFILSSKTYLPLKSIDLRYFNFKGKKDRILHLKWDVKGNSV